MAVPTLSFNRSTLVGSDAAGCTIGTARSGLPEWALLCRVGRNSHRRNATTARSHTSEGLAVEVSFWLVDPPGVSYFSVSCPGYQKFTARLICAEDAFVLVSIACWGSTQDYFVYTARGRGPGPEVTQPLLRLLPHPSPAFYGWQQIFGLLPRGGEHYAVAFVERKVRNWTLDGDFWRFDTHVFSSETRAWRSSQATLAHLSVSDKRLCDQHTFSKQIRVGAGSLGWVDSDHGILLLHNLFDGRPVIDLIPLPRRASPYFFYDVACYDDGLLKLVEIKHDGPGGPDLSTGSEGWRATVWNRRVSLDGWQKRCTVHVDDILVDPTYSALLPELRDDETQELELKKLIFHGPILSVHDEDILCMMGKVNDEDDNAWAITIDMKHGMVEALAQFPAQRKNHFLSTMYSPCVFPKYLNIAQGGSSFYLPVQKKRKKRTRSSRRKKKQQLQISDRRQGLLYLLCIVGCILLVIVVIPLRGFS